MPDSPEHTKLTSHRSNFLRGVKLGMPIFAGYMPVGAAFGIIAVSLGFSSSQAIACSAIVLAGAGQFIALSLMKTGEGIIAVLAATTIVNLRYVLFGATLSPYLRNMPLRYQTILGFTLTDETFAVNIADRRAGLSTGASMAGVGAIAWAGWVMGTFLGATATGLIGDPMRWGVEFAMPAMFTALFVALAEDRRHVAIGLLAGVITIALPLLEHVSIDIPAAWHIVIASVLCATIATMVFRDE